MIIDQFRIHSPRLVISPRKLKCSVLSATQLTVLCKCICRSRHANYWCPPDNTVWIHLPCVILTSTSSPQHVYARNPLNFCMSLGTYYSSSWVQLSPSLDYKWTSKVDQSRRTLVTPGDRSRTTGAPGSNLGLHRSCHLWPVSQLNPIEPDWSQRWGPR